MEIEHQRIAFGLDAAGQGRHVVEVLAHALLPVGGRSLRRVDEEAHAHGVPPGLPTQIGQELHLRAVGVEIVHAVLFIGGQQRDVAAHILLRPGQQRAETQQGE